MKIAVLDGFCLNPGDLQWEAIEALGETVVYDRTSREEVLERSKDFEAVLTNKTVINKQTMEQLPKLKYIGVLATGYNVVDIEAAKELGIVVTNIPAYSTDSVVQNVFAHILNIANQVAHHSAAVKAGRWSSSRDFSFWDMSLMELAGKTIGLVGLGNIGMATAKVANAFGMKVVAMTSKTKDQLPDFITPVDKQTLLSTSDIVSLHCPLNDDTREIINKQSLELMKPTAILINTGRGPLINEQALADALNSGQLFAAGLDVLSSEPPKADNPLLEARNCYITPHIAWATFEARQRLMKIATDNLKAFSQGNPINVINI